MNNSITGKTFLYGLGTGLALMYFFDPNKGAQRRSLLRDKIVALTNDARESLNKTATDLSNRAYGVIAETSKAITGKPIDESRRTANQGF